MAHERIEDVREQGIEEGKALGQDTVHMDVLVHHQGVGSREVGLHEPVQDGVDPGEAVAVEIHGAGDGGAAVQEEMSEHDDVCFHADQFAAQVDVGIQEVGGDDAGEESLEVWSIPGDEDGGIEVRALGVVEGFHVVYHGRLLVFWSFLAIVVAIAIAFVDVGVGVVRRFLPGIPQETLQNQQILAR